MKFLFWLLHALLSIISRKMGVFPHGWEEHKSTEYPTCFLLLAEILVQGETLLLTEELQRCCTGSSCKTEWQATCKCLGKEGTNRINTKHADSLLRFACRVFSAGNYICILLLYRLSWTSLPQCAWGIFH